MAEPLSTAAVVIGAKVTGAGVIAGTAGGALAALASAAAGVVTVLASPIVLVAVGTVAVAAALSEDGNEADTAA